MLFISNLTILSLLIIGLIIKTINTKLNIITPSNIYFSLASTKSSIYNVFTLCTFSSTWKPLFKRSSYIGLVWKSQWKL